MQHLHIKLGNGEKTSFWNDNWCEGGKLKERFPRVFALDTCKEIMVGNKMLQPSLTSSFRRPPRGGAELTQTEDLTNLMHAVSLNHMQDWWIWDLNVLGDFSVASVRNYIETYHAFRKGREYTDQMDSLCSYQMETDYHLFFSCDLAKDITRLILRWWEVPEVDFESYGHWRNWLVNVRLPPKNKYMFEGVFYVLWWTLWSFRNNKIFGGKIQSKAILFDDVTCKSFHWCRARSRKMFSLIDWLKNPSLILL
ncbi:hypothetical protein Tco_1491262 [Tanacetum coccineum]